MLERVRAVKPECFSKWVSMTDVCIIEQEKERNTLWEKKKKKGFCFVVTFQMHDSAFAAHSQSIKACERTFVPQISFSLISLVGLFSKARLQNNICTVGLSSLTHFFLDKSTENMNSKEP